MSFYGFYACFETVMVLFLLLLASVFLGWMKYAGAIKVSLLSYLLWPFRKGIIFLFSLATTFRQTVGHAAGVLQGEEPVRDLPSSFVGDIHNMLLGSIGNASEGIIQINTYLFESGFCYYIPDIGVFYSGLASLWYAVAPIYMMYFIYAKAYREAFKGDHLNKTDRFEIILIIFLVVTVLEGVSDVQGLIENLEMLADNFAGLYPSGPGELTNSTNSTPG